MRFPSALFLAVCLVTAAFWLGCVAVPLAFVLARVSGAGWSSLFDSELISIVKMTAGQAFVSTTWAFLLGLPAGLWFAGMLAREPARTADRVSPHLEKLLAFTYTVPTVVSGMVGILWLGRMGWMARLGLSPDWAYSLRGVIVMHVLLNAPWVALMVLHACGNVPERELEAARTLGADVNRRFRWVIWPRIYPALFAVLAQVFGLCVMSFALVLLLGGGPPVDTLETAIYSRLRSSLLDVSSAAACGVWELVLTLGPWAVLMLFSARQVRVSARAGAGGSARGSAGMRGQGRSAPRDGAAARLLKWVAAFTPLVPFGVFFVLGAPSAVSHLLGLGANLSGGASAELAAPLWVSVRLSVGVACLTLVLALAAVAAARGLGARRPSAGAAASVALALPSGISVLVLGLGFWLAYGRFLDPFEGSFLAMTLLQSTLFFPFAFRTLWPHADGIHSRELEAAITLGASPLTAFFHVEWPRWRGPCLSVLGVAAAASLGEVAAVSLFYSEKLVPLPLLIQRWMSQYRFEDAQALACLLLLLSAGTLALTPRRAR